ncbi:hypothetical protein MMC27_004097 [Xylographa pallens]|nr:hypothetical protein [Xylographa pallens]
MLVLDPGGQNDPLRGILKVTSIALLKTCQYETLSYVWGTGTEMHDILIHNERNERVINFTSNLYEALIRLRLPDKSRTIWADQICIDQENSSERSHQVQFMNQLYKGAAHVLEWLGSDIEGNAHSAFKFIIELDQMFDDTNKSIEFHIAYTKELGTQQREAWVHLYRLMKLEWFNRGWIVQEIGTKAPATLIWGEAEIDWLVLCRVCKKLQNYYHFRSQFRIRTDEVRYLSQRFVKRATRSDQENRSNFIYELHRARRLNFSDQRDRVFAWLGHFSLHESNEQLKTLVADYKKTVAETYTDVAIKALSGEKSTTDGSALIALAAVQHTGLTVGNQSRRENTAAVVRAEKLPSWAPDWRTFQSFMLAEPASPHRAHANSLSRLQVIDHSNLLQIYGLEVDTVQSCSRPLGAREFHTKGNSGGLEPTMMHIWRDVCGQDRFNLKATYVNGESSIFACMQTLGDGCVQIARRSGVQYNHVPKSVWLEHEALYLNEALTGFDAVDADLRELAEKAGKEHEEEQWSRSANGATENRVFARTRKGYYVLGPGVLELGDIVCVLFGGKMPFCLRPNGDGDRFLLVGECYMHGLMDGEAMRMAVRQETVEKLFEIS